MKKIYLLFIALISIQAYSQIQITSTVEYQGYDEGQAYFGEGEYQIFLDNVDGVLDKPVILVDDFDPGDTRDLAGIYSVLDFDGGNIADILRNEGFDFIILNAPQYITDGKDIDGGADYIQRNAMVLRELIDVINTQKVGSEELVVFGLGMGGLISQYGLSYMEQNGMDHETRLFISFDSPHLGANSPVSFQYLLNYFGKEQNNAEADLIVESVLNSPASKEMLIDHYLAHLANGSDFEQDPSILLPTGAPGFRNAFQTELDNLGFPQNVRNVSLVNGSNNGTTIGTPGLQIIDTTLDLGGGVTADIILHFTPPVNQTNNVTDFTAYFAGFPVASFSADSESFSYTAGLDSTPGGMGSFSAGLEGITDPTIIAFLAALEQEEFSSIPTMSALAIETENDWYVSPNMGDSPFVASSISNNNEFHLTITAQKAAFALAEIRQEPLGVSENDFSTKYTLIKNPVGEQIRLKLNSTHSYNNVQYSVFNTSGQQIISERLQNPSEEISINHHLNTGIYFLNITDSETSFNVKIVVQ
ncbi:MAG: T9SS type A sorting domain-containing protein [Flavobacteriaceae bacterium]|nr:T9SS type A sorting domain-containing protein [Flavobacteriaceae bacterium]